MTVAAIYARVSSAQQREEGTIASQTAALLEHAAAQGLEVPRDWIFEDEGYSGATLIRPALARLRDLAAQVGVDVLLCFSPDRLARKYAYQALLIEEFARAGTEVRFIKGPKSDSPEDTLLVQFQGMIAEYERAQIAERSRRGKAHRARAGSVNVLSGAPYGYRYVRKNEHAEARYEIAEPEASNVREIYRRYVEEQLAIGDVTRWLTAQGIATATGKERWDRSKVWGILRNPAYVGRANFAKTMVSDHRPAVTRRVRLQGRTITRHPGKRARPRQEWIEIPVPAIIDEETFAAAARRLEDNQRFASRNTKVPSLLQGLISCQRCGYAFYRSPTQTSARKLYYYRCIGSDGWRFEHGRVCNVRPVRADEIDAMVWQQVSALLADPNLIESELERRLTELRRADPTKAQRKQLELEMSRAQAAANRLVSAYQEDLVGLDELRSRMPELRKRQASIRAQLDALDAQLVDRETVLALAETLHSFLGRLREGAANASIGDRQRIVRLLVKDVLIGPDQVVIRHSIPTSKGPDPPPDYVLRRRGVLAPLGSRWGQSHGRGTPATPATPAHAHLALDENWPVSRRRVLSIFVVAAVAMATGFLVAGQAKVQLLTPSNQVARNQALVRSVQVLEAANADSRQKIAALRAQIDALEAAAAQRSATTQALQGKVGDLRARAGLTPLHGPGVEVDLADGVPGLDTGGGSSYLVNFKDVQDLVNLLFAEGAEGIAVNGHRITPLSYFSGSGAEVIVDQGPPISTPIKVQAVGDRTRMEAALDDPSVLPDIRAREVQFQLQVSFSGSPNISLPAYDSSLDTRDVSPL